ncbi:MAG TPA: non-homologous end-joining DNA ligase [Thermoleophilaceae bacterium]
MTTTIGGRDLRLTNVDRVLWPEAGFTKGAMIDFYAAVADVLVPHLARRPLTLGRWPSGVGHRGFAQNECRGAPEWMETAPLVLASGEVRNYCVVNDAASLVWVANLVAIELHPYLAPVNAPDRPIAVAFDLDPYPPRGLLDACALALRLRELLADRGLEAFPKTSGGTGMHIFVPLDGETGYDESRGFARTLAARLESETPDLVSTSTRPGDRRGRLFVDWMQNSPRRSTVAPYSLRATDVPGVSTPVRWDEIEDALQDRTPTALVFGPDDVRERVRRDGDLWRPMLELRQELPQG